MSGGGGSAVICEVQEGGEGVKDGGYCVEAV